MIYRFKSKASGDVIMLGPNGDQVLRLIGREPAPQGIMEPAALPAAIAALRAAVAAEDAATADGDDDSPKPISLRRRAWPVLELLQRSLAEQQAVVWGV
jgi:hypothetical protein